MSSIFPKLNKIFIGKRRAKYPRICLEIGRTVATYLFKNIYIYNVLNIVPEKETHYCFGRFDLFFRDYFILSKWTDFQSRVPKN